MLELSSEALLLCEHVVSCAELAMLALERGEGGAHRLELLPHHALRALGARRPLVRGA